MAPTLTQRFRAYIDPLDLLFLFFLALVRTFFRAIITGDFTTALLPHRLRERAFANGFLDLREGFRAFEATVVIPDLVASAHGTVVEIGPGIGNQVDRFDKTRIDRIVGIEPNRFMIPALHDAVNAAGLAGRYVILNEGVQAEGLLESAGLRRGEVDCIVSIQVLCSVPRNQVAPVLRELYGWLKPGGEFILYEHVLGNDRMHRLMQRLYTPFWGFCLDGCSLDRPSEKLLLEAGKWDSIELAHDNADETLLPRIHGRLIKARK